jgi:hypothetical protein
MIAFTLSESETKTTTQGPLQNGLACGMLHVTNRLQFGFCYSATKLLDRKLELQNIGMQLPQ